MKRGAFFINASRGDVVDEKALLEALETGTLAGAALDVYSVQPPFNDEALSRIIARENVIATQHVGGQTVEARRTTIGRISEILTEFVNDFNRQ